MFVPSFVPYFDIYGLTHESVAKFLQIFKAKSKNLMCLYMGPKYVYAMLNKNKNNYRGTYFD